MPLGTALIGAGDIGKIRGRAIADSPHLRFVTVADTRPQAAAELANVCGTTAAASTEEAVRRSDVELVIISTPPNTHEAIAIAAIEAGKHVLCEKPLAHTLESAERICAAAEARGVRLITGFNHRYFPAMRFAHDKIASGELGEVIFAKAYAGHPGGVEFGHDWVHEGKVTGGGSLVDNGIHILDLLRYMAGDFVAAQGVRENLVWKFDGAEDNGFALFRGASGAVAQLHASWTDWKGYRFWVEVTGTRGYVRASYPPMFTEWGVTPEPGIRAKRHYEIFPAFQIQERLRSWRWTIIEAFLAEMKDAADWINGGAQPSSTASGRDGLRAMQMANAVYRSSREGRVIAL